MDNLLMQIAQRLEKDKTKLAKNKQQIPNPDNLSWLFTTGNSAEPKFPANVNLSNQSALYGPAGPSIGLFLSVTMGLDTALWCAAASRQNRATGAQVSIITATIFHWESKSSNCEHTMDFLRQMGR